MTAAYKLIQGHQNYAGEDDAHNFQLTGVWYMNFLDGKLSFTGFADLWKENTTVSDDGSFEVKVNISAGDNYYQIIDQDTFSFTPYPYNFGSIKSKGDSQ